MNLATLSYGDTTGFKIVVCLSNKGRNNSYLTINKLRKCLLTTLQFNPSNHTTDGCQLSDLNNHDPAAHV